jgi:fructuronate reductase
MLAGIETVDAAIANPDIHRLIHALMTFEIAPTLNVPLSFDLLAYRDALLERYANPALKHRCAQIAMDGSQKIPLRLLGTLSKRIATGQSCSRLAIAVAAWMQFLLGRTEDGLPYEIHDPLADRLKSLAASAGESPEALVEVLFDVREVFPAELAHSTSLRQALVEALRTLRKGTLRAIAAYA